MLRILPDPDKTRLPWFSYASDGDAYTNPAAGNRRIFPQLGYPMKRYRVGSDGFERCLKVREIIEDWGDAYWLTWAPDERIQWFVFHAEKFVLPMIGDKLLNEIRWADIEKVRDYFEKDAKVLQEPMIHIDKVMCSIFSFALQCELTNNPVLIDFVVDFRPRWGKHGWTSTAGEG